MAKVTRRSQINVQQASAVVTVLLVGVLVGGVVLAKGKPGSGGGGGGNLVYLSPSGGNYQVGSTISVAVRENSGTNAVNAVQAGFNYQTSQLQFNSIDGSASSFTSDLSPPSQTPGTISLTRALFTGSVTGDQLVANVSFTVLGPGRTNLTMTAPCSGTATATCTALSSNGSLLTITTAGSSYKL